MALQFAREIRVGELEHVFLGGEHADEEDRRDQALAEHLEGVPAKKKLYYTTPSKADLRNETIRRVRRGSASGSSHKRSVVHFSLVETFTRGNKRLSEATYQIRSTSPNQNWCFKCFFLENELISKIRL